MVQKLPHKIFLQTLKYAPRATINLLVINKQGEVILTKRSIPPFKSYWHYPGTSIYKGESQKQALLRLAKSELGIKINFKKASLAGVFDDIDDDPRGHMIDIVYKIRVNKTLLLKPSGDTEDLKFFKKLPEKIGFNHRIVLNELGFK